MSSIISLERQSTLRIKASGPEQCYSSNRQKIGHNRQRNVQSEGSKLKAICDELERHEPSSKQYSAMIGVLKRFMDDISSRLKEHVDVVRDTIASAGGTKKPVKAEQAEISRPQVPNDTLDIKSYMEQTFEGKKETTEKESYLATVGWGFNVMADCAKNPKLRDYYNEKREECYDKCVEKGKEPDCEEIANEILQGAVDEGLITEEQARHTKGNAHKAAQMDKNGDSLDNDGVSVDKAIEKLDEALTFFIQNPDKQEYRDL